MFEPWHEPQGGPGGCMVSLAGLLTFLVVAAVALCAGLGAHGAGVPAPKPPPKQLSYADLAGKRWSLSYGGMRGHIEFRPDQTYRHNFGPADQAGRWPFEGAWSVEAGTLTLVELSVSRGAWDRYDCPLSPDAKGWAASRLSGGPMTGQGLAPPGEVRHPVQFTLSAPVPLP